MRLFFSLLILLSFFARATEPVQVFTDDLGRKVTVPAHPKRIVSLHDLDITIPLIEARCTSCRQPRANPA